MSTLKKYIITCNEGSLGGGGRGNTVEIVEWSTDIDAAKRQFNGNQFNRMYGRRIISIKEFNPNGKKRFSAAGAVVLFMAAIVFQGCVHFGASREAKNDYSALRTHYQWMTPQLFRIIDTSSKKHGIDPHLISAVIHAESRGQNVVSRVNKNGTRDYGYCQINSVHRPEQPESFLDPETNIDMGCRFLSYCMKKGGNDYEAVRMYNAGPNSRPGKSKNQKYVLKVLAAYMATGSRG